MDAHAPVVMANSGILLPPLPLSPPPSLSPSPPLSPPPPPSPLLVTLCSSPLIISITSLSMTASQLRNAGNAASRTAFNAVDGGPGGAPTTRANAAVAVNGACGAPVAPAAAPAVVEYATPVPAPTTLNAAVDAPNATAERGLASIASIASSTSSRSAADTVGSPIVPVVMCTFFCCTLPTKSFTAVKV